MKTTGGRLLYARQRKGLTQHELAFAIGKSKTAISAYENNVITPRVKEFVKLAEVLQTDMDWLRYGELQNAPSLLAEYNEESGEQEPVKSEYSFNRKLPESSKSVELFEKMFEQMKKQLEDKDELIKWFQEMLKTQMQGGTMGKLTGNLPTGAPIIPLYGVSVAGSVTLVA
ncbi:MAG: helix-turn-helix domain-containing protein [Bacteroidota bacterium]